MNRTQEQDPDSPVLLTAAGEQAAKVRPLVKALAKIIILCDGSDELTADDHVHKFLFEVGHVAMAALIQVKEHEVAVTMVKEYRKSIGQPL